MLPQGGLIAAIHGKKRRQNEEDDFSSLLEPPHVYKDRMEAVDVVLEDLESHSIFGPSSGKPDHSHNVAVDGLLEKVEDRLHRSHAYFKLAATALFFILFAILLFTQRNVTDSYSMESSIINQIIGQLPTLGTGGYTNSNVGAAGMLTSSDDFFTWLSSAVISNVFTDPVCGDGTCDAPDEYPGFGRFGCVADCGSYLQVTPLTVDLEDVIGTSQTSLGWDVSGLPSIANSEKAGFKFNIYSETMGDFLFADDQSPTTSTTISTDVPDGKLTLVMYQTTQTSSLVDLATIYNFYPFVQSDLFNSTVPARSSFSDYEYGDEREYLTSSFLVTQGIINYCATQPNNPTSSPPSICTNLYSFDMFLRVLSSYGLNGTITMKPTSSQSSETLVQVGFCSVLPNTSGGAFSTQNRQFFQGAKDTCQSRRNMPVSSWKMGDEARLKDIGGTSKAGPEIPTARRLLYHTTTRVAPSTAAPSTPAPSTPAPSTPAPRIPCDEKFRQVSSSSTKVAECNQVVTTQNTVYLSTTATVVGTLDRSTCHPPNHPNQPKPDFAVVLSMTSSNLDASCLQLKQSVGL
eukprot:763734-Hanusia_phi.AAC.1